MCKDKDKDASVTPEAIMAWANKLMGIPASKTAKDFKIHRNTVTQRVKKVEEYVNSKIEINNYRIPLFGLYSLGLKSLIKNLKSGNPTVTIAFFKGLGLFTETVAVDDDDISNFTDDELDAYEQRIIDGIAERIQSAGRRKKA